MRSQPTTKKLLLLAGERTTAEGAPAVPIRRFRLARVRPASNHVRAEEGRRSDPS